MVWRSLPPHSGCTNRLATRSPPQDKLVAMNSVRNKRQRKQPQRRRPKTALAVTIVELGRSADRAIAIVAVTGIGPEIAVNERRVVTSHRSAGRPAVISRHMVDRPAATSRSIAARALIATRIVARGVDRRAGNLNGAVRYREAASLKKSGQVARRCSVIRRSTSSAADRM